MNYFRLCTFIAIVSLAICGSVFLIISCGLDGETVGYWMLYDDHTIPEEAFQAGITRIDEEDVGVYVGQVFMEEIVPGAGKQIVAIYNNTDYVVSTYEDLIQMNTSVKILCLKKGKKVKWISSKLQDKYEADYHFIIGGHELSKTTSKKANLYIGRGIYNNTLVVGKVDLQSPELHFRPYYNGKEILIKDNFEVLGYASYVPDPH